MHTLFAPTNRWRAYGLGGCLIATCLVLVPPASAQPAKTRTDALGDPLPEGALYRIGTTRLHPGAPVEAMTFSADGKSLITATLATGVHVWEVATGKELRALP